MVYTAIIAEAIPGLTQLQYEAIEEVMRKDIFHSTLDWQPREELYRAAVEAVGILTVIAQYRNQLLSTNEVAQ